MPCAPGATAELRAAAEGTAVHVLENDEVVLDGVRFLGCTLWSDFMAAGEQELVRLGARWPRWPGRRDPVDEHDHWAAARRAIEDTVPMQDDLAESRRQDTVDAAMEMADRLVHTQYDFLRNVVHSAGKGLRREDDGK